jgi:hypothetical protein
VSILDDVLTSNGYVLNESSDRLGWLERVPTHESTSKEALLGRLDRDGYLFMPGFLDPGVVEGFRDYYFNALAPAGLLPVDDGSSEPDRATLRRILFSRIVPGREYEALCQHPVIKEWFSWLLGDDVHLHKRKILRHIRPGEIGVGVATQAHYDLVYLREGSDRVISMWIPLGDCPVERGGLVYLEGSHHRIRLEEREGRLQRPAKSLTANLPALADEYGARWLRANYRAGDVVVHCSQIVHAALDNTDVHRVVRLSTDIRYQRKNDPIDARWQNHWVDTDGL